jgi:pyruvate dehydrogenase E2 component (dihydrolipoamide acetyltransferase)
MPREIVMPQLSETMTEGDLVAWLVPEGAKLRAGEPIAEIETDKSTVELEAPEDGTLERIVVRAGAQAVAVGQVLAILRGVEARDSTATVTRAEPIPSQREAPRRAAPPRGASPLARRMAAQSGLDIEAITGSGADGRIVRSDVERALGRIAKPRAIVAEAKPAEAVTGSFRVERLSRARRTVGERLAAAKREIPHFYLHVDCEIGAAVSLREQLNARSQARRYSLTDFVVRAAALALREVPDVNASFVDGELRLHTEVDIAIAVASDAGLITPIVRSAARKSLAEISDEARELVARARAGRLSAQEYQGGTFSVSNLGMFGVDGLYAIVNPPQVAILGVGRVHPRPVARAGAVVVEPVTQLTLSADHRVVDGAIGAKLLGAIRAHLEDPLSLLV